MLTTILILSTTVIFLSIALVFACLVAGFAIAALRQQDKALVPAWARRFA